MNRQRNKAGARLRAPAKAKKARPKAPEGALFSMDSPPVPDRLLKRLKPTAEAAKAKRGRPRSEAPKEVLNVRVDAETLKAFRATGAGWQRRVNEALKRAATRLK